MIKSMKRRIQFKTDDSASHWFISLQFEMNGFHHRHKSKDEMDTLVYVILNFSIFWEREFVYWEIIHF